MEDIFIKKAIGILVFLTCLTTASAYGKNAILSSQEAKLSSQKVYVNLTEVLFDASGIWVEESGETLRINSLHFDQCGYYYNAQG